MRSGRCCASTCCALLLAVQCPLDGIAVPDKEIAGASSSSNHAPAQIGLQHVSKEGMQAQYVKAKEAISTAERAQNNRIRSAFQEIGNAYDEDSGAVHLYGLRHQDATLNSPVVITEYELQKRIAASAPPGAPGKPAAPSASGRPIRPLAQPPVSAPAAPGKPAAPPASGRLPIRPAQPPSSDKTDPTAQGTKFTLVRREPKYKNLFQQREHVVAYTPERPGLEYILPLKATGKSIWDAPPEPPPDIWRAPPGRVHPATPLAPSSNARGAGASALAVRPLPRADGAS